MTIEQVISKVHTAAPEHDFAPGFPSVDTIKYGDIKKECTGVALACAPSAQVLKTMGEKGLNLLIAHEPLFYTNVDTTDWLEAKSDVYEAKKAILDKYHIVVWRYHDHMHVHKPDMIYTGVARELGWMPYLEGDKNKPVFFRLPETTLKKLAEYLKEKIGLNNVRCIGNMNAKVSTVYMCGHLHPSGDEREQAHVRPFFEKNADVLIPGEILDWTAISYARDAGELGLNKAIINLGHFNLEELGMKGLVPWVKDVLENELPVEYVKSADTYNYLS